MSDLLEFVRQVVALVEGMNRGLEMVKWTVNAGLDLFLHAAWSGLACLFAFSLTYWGTRGLYFIGASLSRSPTSPPARIVRGMVRLSWCCSLFAGWAAHCWWDRLLTFG